MAEMRKASQLAARRFLVSEAGQELIATLKDTAPAIVSGEPHEIMFAAGIAQGWRLCVNKIIEASDPVSEKEIDLEMPGLKE